MSATARQKVLDYAASAPSPTRRELGRHRFVAGAAAALWTGTVLLVFHGVRIAPRPDWLFAATALGSALLAGVAVWLVAHRGEHMLGRSLATLVAVVGVVPLALFAWKVGVTACAQGMLEPFEGRTGVRCFFVSLLSGLGPFAALLWARHGSVLEHAQLYGVATGVAVGAIGWTVNELRCQVGYVPHVLLGHVLPIVVFSLIGFLAARWLAPRWISPS